MFARTKRLFLRPAWAEDEAALVAAIGHEQVVRNLATAPWPYGPEDARQAIARSAACPPHEANCLIFMRTSGLPVLIGGIGFGRHLASIPHPELGYWISPAYWGHGYACEAGEAVLEFAFLGLGLKALWAGHFFDNPASGRVLAKLGFRPARQVTRHHCLARGYEVETIAHEISRQDWLAGRAAFREAA